MQDLKALVARLKLAHDNATKLVVVLEGNHDRLLAALPPPNERTMNQSAAIAQAHGMLMDAGVAWGATSSALAQAEHDLYRATPRAPSALECEIDNLQWEIDELLSSIEIDGEKGRQHYVDMHRRRLAELEEQLDELRR